MTEKIIKEIPDNISRRYSQQRNSTIGTSFRPPSKGNPNNPTNSTTDDLLTDRKESPLNQRPIRDPRKNKETSADGVTVHTRKLRRRVVSLMLLIFVFYKEKIVRDKKDVVFDKKLVTWLPSSLCSCSSLCLPPFPVQESSPSSIFLSFLSPFFPLSSTSRQIANGRDSGSSRKSDGINFPPFQVSSSLSP